MEPLFQDIPPLRILIVGHSQARRVAPFLADNNLGFPRDQVVIRCVGIGGLRIASLVGSRLIYNELRSFSPDAVLMMIGDNDINHYRSANVISEQLLDAAEILYASTDSVMNVIICQILPRHPGSYLNSSQAQAYNHKARTINRRVKRIIAQSDIRHIQAAHFREFCFQPDYPIRFENSMSFYSGDGVHLNSQGYNKLASRLKGLVIRLIRA